jgi:hypothetical protein
VGNKEIEYSVPDRNGKIINITNELSDAHKKSLRGNYGRDHCETHDEATRHS